MATVLGTLPAGYRPGTSTSFILPDVTVGAANSGKFLPIRIDADGTINVPVDLNLTMTMTATQIGFRAEG
jgi:hypothetical protein